MVLLVTVDMENIWHIYSTIFQFISTNFGSKVQNISKLSDCLFIITIYQKVRQLRNGRWTHTHFLIRREFENVFRMLKDSIMLENQRSYHTINKISRLIIMCADGSTYLYSLEYDSQMCSQAHIYVWIQINVKDKHTHICVYPYTLERT